MDFDVFGEDISGEFDTEMEFEETAPAPAPAGTPLEVLPGFDVAAGSTWIYPSNMSHRKYQFDIVQSSLYNNTLVCLPTGLGKTFIAAVIMYNFYRWYPRGKIVFMAPTKPLVGQQIEACFKVMGIPQSDTVEMTGEVGQKERVAAWKEKRVFFLTPQVLNSDLTRGRCSAGDIKLLIVDEAHRALGEYAYCKAVRELVRAGAMTRIVALSATPGSDIASVKKMIQNLCISHIEIRQEDSPDIVPYTHRRTIDKIVIKISKDVSDIKLKLMSVIEIYTKKLSAAQAVTKGHLPSSYSKWILINCRDQWRQAPAAGASKAVQGVVEADFATALNLYSGLELLLKQGLRSVYNFYTKTDINSSTKRIRGELYRIPAWREIMSHLGELYSGDTSNSLLNQGPALSQADSTRAVDLLQTVSTSHPKMDKLLEVVKDHFQNFVSDDRETKVIIFNDKRDCVNELVACLSKLKPLVRPKHFVGQASSANSRGLNQKEQIEIVKRFKEGVYNTIVATCVGEEGLDIGEVDLIVLYDMKTSPISYVQRIGRTGRKRDGRVVVLVTEGLEEREYKTCLYQVRNINKELQDQTRLENVLFSNAPRMIPRGLSPTCHPMKMIVRDWEPKPGVSEDRGLLNAARVRVRAKDDVFRNNRGALTEEELERWRNLERFGGKVKRVKDPRELWSEERKDPFESQHLDSEQSFYELSEFSLWQTGQQNRRLVSAGTLSKTYTKILNLIKNPGALKGRREKRRSGDRITDYYVLSQSRNEARDRNRQLGNIIEIDDDDDDDEFVTGHTSVKMDVEVIQDQHDVDDDIALEEREELEEEEELCEPDLLKELLPEDDSGILSLCSSPPDIQRLIDNPPSKTELENFDLSAAIEKALTKLGEKRPPAEVSLLEDKTELVVPQSLLVYPVARNDTVEDIFADDDSFSEVFNPPMEIQKEDPVTVIKSQENIAVSNFDLGSPVFEEEEEEVVNQENGQPEAQQVEEPAEPELPGRADFDLGSPVFESEEIVKSNFAIDTPVRSDFEAPSHFKISEHKASTSTPIVPFNSKQGRTEELKKTFEIKQLDESEDMFGDDSMDDQLFLEADEAIEANEKKTEEQSLYNTTALVKMMDVSKSSLDRTGSSLKGRRKLTDIFDSISVNNVSGSSVEVKNKTRPSDEAEESTSGLSSSSKEVEKNDRSEETRSNGSGESANLLADLQEPGDGGETNVCPVCAVTVPGDLAKLNQHLDICLNTDVIQEMTQNEEPSHLQRSQSPETSPLISNKARRRVIASQSVQSVEQSAISTSSEESLVHVRKKPKASARQFIDSEADLSGAQTSEDEAEVTEDHYDESFVDDASQAVDHAVYLQSVKSPEFRKPFSRPLRPITEDIFSQPVHEREEEDSYEEDSFCVGDSMVELDSCHDTLDLLEQEAEDADRRGRRKVREVVNQQKRKRILINSSSEESFGNSSSVTPKKGLKRKRIITIPSDDESDQDEKQRKEEPEEDLESSITDQEPSSALQSPIIKSQRRNTPKAARSGSLSRSRIEAEKMTVIFSSREVSRSEEVVSILKHYHQFRVSVERCDPVSVVAGRDTAILRIPEPEFNLGTAKEKLIKRLHQVQDCYSEVLIIVELERKKPGDRPRGGVQRTKLLDLTVSQLSLAGIKVCYSPGDRETAEMISRVTVLAEERGRGLPRVEYTAGEQETVRWLQDIPGLGLGMAHTLAVSFQSPRALVSATSQRLVERGADRRTAERLVTFFRETFQPALTELAPL